MKLNTTRIISLFEEDEPTVIIINPKYHDVDKSPISYEVKVNMMLDSIVTANVSNMRKIKEMYTFNELDYGRFWLMCSICYTNTKEFNECYDLLAEWSKYLYYNVQTTHYNLEFVNKIKKRDEFNKYELFNACFTSDKKCSSINIDIILSKYTPQLLRDTKTSKYVEFDNEKDDKSINVKRMNIDNMLECYFYAIKGGNVLALKKLMDIKVEKRSINHKMFTFTTSYKWVTLSGDENEDKKLVSNIIDEVYDNFNTRKKYLNNKNLECIQMLKNKYSI